VLFVWVCIYRSFCPTLPAFSLGDVTKRTNAMSKAGEKRSLAGGDEDKLPFTDEQLVALEEPNKGELHTKK
jgi:hypothetical protein